MGDVYEPYVTICSVPETRLTEYYVIPSVYTRLLPIHKQYMMSFIKVCFRTLVRFRRTLIPFFCYPTQIHTSRTPSPLFIFMFSIFNPLVTGYTKKFSIENPPVVSVLGVSHYF